MYDTSEEVDEVQFGNLDAAIDQLIFARSSAKEKMKRDPESRSRSGHSGDRNLPEITEPPRDRTSLHELARVGDTLALIKLLEEMPKGPSLYDVFKMFASVCTLLL